MQSWRTEGLEYASPYPIRAKRGSLFKISVVLIFIPLVLFPFTDNTIARLEKQLNMPGIGREEKIRLSTQLSELTQDRDALKAEKYGKKALEFLQGLDNPLLEVRALLSLTRAAQHLGDYQTALTYGDKAETIARESGLQEFATSSYNHISRIYYQLGFLDRSLEYALRAQKSSEESDDYKNIAEAYTNIGNIYKAMNDNKSALEHYYNAMLILKELDDKKSMATVLIQIGNVYHSYRQYKEAEKYYWEIHKIAKGLDWEMGLAAALMGIAAVRADKGDPTTALAYDEEALEISQKIGQKRNIATILGHIGTCYRTLGKYKKALQHVNQAMDIAQTIKNKDITRNLYKELFEVYGAITDYKQAYLYYDESKTINNEIFSEESQENISQLWRKYKIGIKAEGILQLIRDNSAQKLKLERRELVRNFFIVISLLTLILAGVLYNRYRIEKKTERLLKESELKLRAMNTAKDKLFSIIAHDLESPLNGLLLSTAYMEKNYRHLEENEAKEFLRHICENANHMAKLLDNLLQWAVSQLGKLEVKSEVFDLNQSAGDTVALMKPSAAEKSIHLVSHIDENTLAWADRRMTETIMRNLVSNAVKYSRGGDEVHITCAANGNYLEVAVADNGVGIPGDKLDSLFDPHVHNSTRGTAGEKGIGLGLILCKEFVEKNGGTLRAESNNGNETHTGTRMIFTLPAPTVQSRLYHE